ncbi:uncharacterized protein LOC132557653 [Ylistrum balloti]|uniref:uncharacterized protein LOC132557653 n=1 Tax=Ylistrum balloti TaxID=509963 RepID=UPI002905A76F|nr:uncharacterized protein LOC132557653 [Ylistrum balloti]
MTPSTINALLICLGMYTVNSSVNVAFMKPTWMSSGLDGYIRPELVVDGFLFNWIHTGHEEFPRWWVNLTQNCTLARINIYYRTSWGRRMTGYKFIVSNTESTHPWNRGHQIEGHICRTETRSEPPVQQTVPCLTRGSFITYADDQTYTNDPNPFVELSELEAFGCVTGWYGQGNCEEQCPEGCWDGVCNPDNGTCFTGCKSGLQGQTCNKCEYYQLRIP